MTDLLSQLSGGDLRSIGKANAVVRIVVADPSRLNEVIYGLSSEDRIVRMRCADVAEKISCRIPGCLVPYGSQLLKLAARAREPELCWHLAQMLPRSSLDGPARAKAASVLFGYLEHDSRIVRTFALQALAEFAAQDPRLRRKVRPLIDTLATEASGAVGARARRLRAMLGKFWPPD